MKLTLVNYQTSREWQAQNSLRLKQMCVTWTEHECQQLNLILIQRRWGKIDAGNYCSHENET